MGKEKRLARGSGSRIDPLSLGASEIRVVLKASERNPKIYRVQKLEEFRVFMARGVL